MFKRHNSIFGDLFVKFRGLVVLSLVVKFHQFYQPPKLVQQKHAKATEKLPGLKKERIVYKNHPFSGVSDVKLSGLFLNDMNL